MCGHLPVCAPLTLFPNFAKKWEGHKGLPIFTCDESHTYVAFISVVSGIINSACLVFSSRVTGPAIWPSDPMQVLLNTDYALQLFQETTLYRTKQYFCRDQGILPCLIPHLLFCSS